MQVCYLCRGGSGCHSESCCSAEPRPRCHCRYLLLPPRWTVTDLHAIKVMSCQWGWEGEGGEGGGGQSQHSPQHADLQ